MVNFIFNYNRETICTNCSKHTVTGRHYVFLSIWKHRRL